MLREPRGVLPPRTATWPSRGARLYGAGGVPGAPGTNWSRPSSFETSAPDDTELTLEAQSRSRTVPMERLVSVPSAGDSARRVDVRVEFRRLRDHGRVDVRCLSPTPSLRAHHQSESTGQWLAGNAVKSHRRRAAHHSPSSPAISASSRPHTTQRIHGEHHKLSRLGTSTRKLDHRPVLHAGRRMGTSDHHTSTPRCRLGISKVHHHEGSS